MWSRKAKKQPRVPQCRQQGAKNVLQKTLRVRSERLQNVDAKETTEAVNAGVISEINRMTFDEVEKRIHVRGIMKIINTTFDQAFEIADDREKTNQRKWAKLAIKDVRIKWKSKLTEPRRSSRIKWRTKVAEAVERRTEEVKAVPEIGTV